MFKPEKLVDQRNSILSDFRKLGFVGSTAFYNICKSKNPTLNSYALVCFWKGGFCFSRTFTNAVRGIVDSLQYE